MVNQRLSRALGRHGSNGCSGGGGAELIRQRCFNCGFGLGQFGVEFNDQFCSLDCFTNAKVTGRNPTADPRYGNHRLAQQAPWPRGLMVEAPPSPKPWRGRTWSCDSWRTAHTANLTVDGGDSDKQNSPTGHWNETSGGAAPTTMDKGRQRSSTTGGVEESKACDPRPDAVPSGNTRSGGARVDFSNEDLTRYADLAIIERGRRVNATEDGRVLAGGTGGGRVPGNGGSGGHNAGIDGHDGNNSRGSAGGGRGRENGVESSVRGVRCRNVGGRMTTTFGGERNDIHGAVIDTEVTPHASASSKSDCSDQQHQPHSTTVAQTGDCNKSDTLLQRNVTQPAAPPAHAAAAAMTAMTAGGPGAAGVRTAYPRQQRTWYGWGGARKVEVRTLDVSKACVAPAQNKEQRPIVVAPVATRPGVERPRAVAGIAGVAKSGVDRTEAPLQASAEPSKENNSGDRRKTGHSKERSLVGVVGCEVGAPVIDHGAGKNADDAVTAASTTSPGAGAGSGSDEGGVILRGTQDPEKQTNRQRGDGQDTYRQGTKHGSSSKGNVTRPAASPTVVCGGGVGGSGGSTKSPGGGQRGVSSVISVGVDKSPGRQRIVCPVVRAGRTRDTVRQWRHLFLP